MTHRKAHRRCKDRDKEKSSSSTKSGGGALLEAATTGNLSKIKSLLKNGTGVHFQDHRGRDALMHAAIGGQVAAASLLLENNADPTHVDGDGCHGLIHAVKNGSKGVIDLILTVGRTNQAFQNVINIQDEKNRTAIHYAVLGGSKSIIQTLLKEKNLNLYLPTGDSRGGIVSLSYALWDESTSPREDKRGKKRPRPQDIREITKMLVDEVHRRKELGKLWGLLLGSMSQKEDSWPSDLFGTLPVTALLQETGNTMNDPDVLYSLISEVAQRISQERYPPQLSPVDIDVLLDITLDVGDGSGYSTLKKTIGILEAVICPMEYIPAEPDVNLPKESSSECETLRGAPSSTSGAARAGSCKKNPSASSSSSTDVKPDDLPYLTVVWRHVHVGHLTASNINGFLPPGSEGSLWFKQIDSKYSELALELGNKTRLGTRLLQQDSPEIDVWSASLNALLDLHKEVSQFTKTYGHLSDVDLGLIEPLPCKTSQHCLQPQMSKEHLTVVLIHILELLERNGVYMIHNLHYIDNTTEKFVLLTVLSLWLLTQLGRDVVLEQPRLQSHLESLDSLWCSFCKCVGYLDDAISEHSNYDRFSVLLFCMFYWLQSSMLYRKVDSVSPDISEVVKLFSKGGEGMRIPVRVESSPASKKSDAGNANSNTAATTASSSNPALERSQSFTASAKLPDDLPTGNSELFPGTSFASGDQTSSASQYTIPLLELTHHCFHKEALMVDTSIGVCCPEQQTSFVYPKVLNCRNDPHMRAFQSVAPWARCKPRREEQVYLSNPINMDIFNHSVKETSEPNAATTRAVGVDVTIKWLAGWNIFRGCHEVLSTRSRNSIIWKNTHPVPDHHSMHPVVEEFPVSELVQTIGGALQLLASLPVNPEFLHFCMARIYEINHGILKGRLEGNDDTTRGTNSLEVFVKHPQLLPLVAPVIAKEWIRMESDHMGRHQLHKLKEAVVPTDSSIIQPLFWVAIDKGSKQKKSEEKKELELKGQPIPKWSLVDLSNFAVQSSLQMGFVGIADDARSDSSSDADEDSSSAGWRTLRDDKHDGSLDMPPAANTTTQTSWHGMSPDRLFRSVRAHIYTKSDIPQYPFPKQFVDTGMGAYVVSVPELRSILQDGQESAPHVKHEFVIGTPTACGTWVQQQSTNSLYPFKTPDGTPALTKVDPFKVFLPPSSFEESTVFFIYEDYPVSYMVNIDSWDEFKQELAKALKTTLRDPLLDGEHYHITGGVSTRTSSGRVEATVVRADKEYPWPAITSLEYPLRIRKAKNDPADSNKEGETVAEEEQSSQTQPQPESEPEPEPQPQPQQPPSEGNVQTDDSSDQWTTDSNSVVSQNKFVVSRAFPGMLSSPDDYEPSSSYSSDYIGMALKVDRNDFFSSILDSVLLKSVSDGIEVEFVKEPGSGDGPNKEFFGMLASELFHSPKHQLFVPAMDGDNRRALMINKELPLSPEVLMKYFVCGRLLAFAMANCYEVGGIELVRGYYKVLLSHPVVLSDLRNIDVAVHTGMVWLLENTVTEDMGITFIHTVKIQEKYHELNLVENGDTLLVNESNKEEYVRLKLSAMHTAGVEPFLQALASGFWSEAPSALCRYILCANDLSSSFAGISEISAEEWEIYTSYESPKLAQSNVVKWFWEYVRSLSQEDKRDLLTFATGSSTLPVGGFAGLAEYNGDLNASGKAFTIDIIAQQSDGNGQPMCDSKLQLLLPSAQTCFNTLLLPNYNSYERLKERLDIAIHMGHKGYDEE